MEKILHTFSYQTHFGRILNVSGTSYWSTLYHDHVWHNDDSDIKKDFPSLFFHTSCKCVWNSLLYIFLKHNCREQQSHNEDWKCHKIKQEYKGIALHIYAHSFIVLNYVSHIKPKNK